MMIKEEHGESEASFCSARYYRPLVHPLSYGNQILSMGPHLIAAKLMRRIYLLEPLHTLQASKGEPVSFSKMLGRWGGIIVLFYFWDHCFTVALSCVFFLFFLLQNFDRKFAWRSLFCTVLKGGNMICGELRQ
jgi:hypothetical protein